MKIAYSICTANYLPFAKSVGDSLITNNPDYLFYIILVDTYRGFDQEEFKPHQIVYVDELGIEGFEEMSSKYTLFELSCALKPFAADYLMKINEHVEVCCYFDSDILVFGKLTEAEQNLKNNSVVLTTHINKPIEEDGFHPTDKIILKAGLYNGGFFALKQSVASSLFIEWWKSRLSKDSFIDTLGDQMWLNYVPLFFDQIYINRSPEYNAAYWNLQERAITYADEKYFVNGKPLVFFHFSGYDINTPDVISKHQNRFTFEQKEEIKPLFDLYREQTLKNGYDEFSIIKSPYGFREPEPVPPPKKKKLLEKLFGL